MIKQRITTGTDTLQSKNTQDVFVGDQITALRIGAMPSSRFGNQEFAMDWATKDIQGKVVEGTVIDREIFIRSGYYKINLMHFVADQPILIKRNDFWEWKKPPQIQKGDVMFGHSTQFQVETISFIEVSVQTFELKVDMCDTYFLNGILVHNRV